MITGSPSVPIARTHTPRIGNIPGVGIDGALVSFEKSAPAFSSYGKEQSLNAPCSISSTWAYSLALQYLVDHEKHHVRVSGTKCCFWAQENEQHTVLFSDLLNSPQPDEVRKFLLSPWTGIGIPREEAQRDRFFAVTLAGNSGRIAVRHWMQCPLDKAIENLNLWFKDLQLEIPPMPAKQKTKTSDKSGKEPSAPLSLFRLACTTVREAKDLQPEVPAMLYRAALEGSCPSVALLKPILHRLHSRLVKDENYRVVFDESRFALLKLIVNRVNRNRKESDMEIQSKLTADTTDTAYNCGRLLAVFDALQQSAHRAGNPGGRLNNTIAEKYFGSASGSPSSAFAILWRLHQHHLKKLRQSGKESAAASYRAQIAEISTRFQMKNADGAPVFPRTLTLMEQARFALGFYQQEAARMEAIRKWKEEQGAKAGAESEILT